jgi:hypothetical protein
MAIRLNNIDVITDTANLNVTHLGISSLGHIAVGVQTQTSPPHAGSLYGYAGGGVNPTLSPTFFTAIDRHSFSSDTNATNVASMAVQRRRSHSASSEQAGYAMGGDALAPTALPPFQGFSYYFGIEKFNFATEAPATAVGSLQFVRINSGQGCASPTHGYTGGSAIYNMMAVQIERFPFSIERETAGIGGLTYNRLGTADGASLNHGYNVSGLIQFSPNITTTIIERFQFAAESDGVVVGDVYIGRQLFSVLSSPTHLYSAGGVSSTPVVRYKTIDKMPFTAEGTATLVGELSSNNGSTAATTSATNGYVLGGATSNNPPAPVVGTNAIDKFPFSTDANAADVADLSATKFQTTNYMN